MRSLVLHHEIITDKNIAVHPVARNNGIGCEEYFIHTRFTVAGVCFAVKAVLSLRGTKRSGVTWQSHGSKTYNEIATSPLGSSQ